MRPPVGFSGIFSPDFVSRNQGRHLRGAGGRRPQRKRKKEIKMKKEKKKKKKGRKNGGNYEKRQITTYKVLFFSNFSIVNGKLKKNLAPKKS